MVSWAARSAKAGRSPDARARVQYLHQDSRRQLAAAGAAVVIAVHEVPTLMAAAHHVTWCTAGTTYELGSPAAAMEHASFRRDHFGC